MRFKDRTGFANKWDMFWNERGETGEEDVGDWEIWGIWQSGYWVSPALILKSIRLLAPWPPVNGAVVL